jgi:hypothetical protein
MRVAWTGVWAVVTMARHWRHAVQPCHAGPVADHRHPVSPVRLLVGDLGVSRSRLTEIATFVAFNS